MWGFKLSNFPSKKSNSDWITTRVCVIEYLFDIFPMPIIIITMMPKLTTINSQKEIPCFPFNIRCCKDYSMYYYSGSLKFLFLAKIFCI